MIKLLCTLLLASTGIQLVAGDYHIGYSINSYNNPSNSLSDGSCCDGTCSAGSCRTTLRLCFRETNHSLSDTNSDCTAVRNHDSAEFFMTLATDEPSIPVYYQEMFQLYVRVSHSAEQNTSLADFVPPFTDPHIDDIFIEADIESITYDSLNLVSTTYTRAGVFGRATLSVSLHVRCAQNYYGPACEMLCDSNGINCNTVLEPPTLTTSASDNMENESSTTMTPDMSTNSPTSFDDIDPTTQSTLSTSSTQNSSSGPERPSNATTRRMPPSSSRPSRLSSGVLAGIIVACVLILIGIVVITLTVIAVAVCVHRKQKKTIHKLQIGGSRGTVLERNEIYESASHKPESVRGSEEDGSEAASVHYESMDALRDAIETEANNAYDTAPDIEDTYDTAPDIEDTYDTYESVS